jgi:hypothetical protein
MFNRSRFRIIAAVLRYLEMISYHCSSLWCGKESYHIYRSVSICLSYVKTFEPADWFLRDLVGIGGRACLHTEKKPNDWPIAWFTGSLARWTDILFALLTQFLTNWPSNDSPTYWLPDWTSDSHFTHCVTLRSLTRDHWKRTGSL